MIQQLERDVAADRLDDVGSQGRQRLERQFQEVGVSQQNDRLVAGIGASCSLTSSSVLAASWTTHGDRVLLV